MRQAFFSFILAFGFVAGSFARAEECAMSRAASQHYDLAVAACLAEMKSYKCSEAVAQMKPRLRKCTPEAMRQEAADRFKFTTIVPGCTGITAAKLKSAAQAVARVPQAVQNGAGNVAACATSWECMKQVPLETFLNIGRGALFFAMPVVNFGKEAATIVAHPVEAKRQNDLDRAVIHRAWVCYDDLYRYQIACELVGGTFSRAAAVIAMAKGVAVVAEAGGLVAAEAGGAASESSAISRLQTRASVVHEREVAGRGVRPAVITRTRAAAVGSASAGSLASTAAAKKLTRAPAKSADDVAREDYLERLVGRQNTTVAQRKAFEELALKTHAKGNAVFIDLQNSKMKFLNDSLGNKNIVTAITNHRLELMFDDLKALKAKYPQMKEISYDDFKSGRRGFEFADGKIPPGFSSDVDRIMKASEDKFIAELGQAGVLPEGLEADAVAKSFAQGKGATPDQANVASRYAARTGQSGVNFWDPVVKKNLEGRLAATDTYRAGLMTSLKKTSLVEKLPNGEYVPTADVFEAYRKTTNASDLAKVIQERTGVVVPAQQAANIRNYLKQLDEWSTGLLITDARESVTFAGSAHNGVTIDISGMGALNMRELSKSMIGVRDVDQALAKARAAERSATATFEENKQHIVDAARESLAKRGIETDIRISGDDIIVLPKNKPLDQDALQAMHEAIAKSPSSSNVRLSAVESGAKDADVHAVAGESLEKKVRGYTLKSVSDQSNYTLMVVSDGKGSSTLKVAARQGVVSPDVEKAFQDALQKARENN